MSNLECGKDVVSVILINPDNKLKLIISDSSCEIEVHHVDASNNVLYAESITLPNAITVTGETLHLLDKQFNKIVDAELGNNDIQFETIKNIASNALETISRGYFNVCKTSCVKPTSFVNDEVLIANVGFNSNCNLLLISNSSYFSVIIKWGHSREQSIGAIYGNSNGGISNNSCDEILTILKEWFTHEVFKLINMHIPLKDMINSQNPTIRHLVRSASDMYEEWFSKSENQIK